MTPDQQALIQEAVALAPEVALGEAYRHVSSSAVLEDFIARLEPLGLDKASSSLEAIKVLAAGGQASVKDQRRMLTLCKLVVRVEKTRKRLKRDHWLTKREAAQARQGKH